jgi:hypothetical protein
MYTCRALTAVNAHNVWTSTDRQLVWTNMRTAYVRANPPSSIVWLRYQECYVHGQSIQALSCQSSVPFRPKACLQVFAYTPSVVVSLFMYVV